MCELEQDFAEISVSEYTYLYIHYILIFALCYMVFFTKNRIDFFVDVNSSATKVVRMRRLNHSKWLQPISLYSPLSPVKFTLSSQYASSFPLVSFFHGYTCALVTSLTKKRISPAINIFDKSLYEHSVSNRCRYEEVPIQPQACSLCHYLLHHWHFPRLKSWDSTSTRLLANPVLHFSVTEWCLIRVGIFTQGNQSQRKPLYFCTGAQIIPQKPYPAPALRSRFSQQAANRTA